MEQQYYMPALTLAFLAEQPFYDKLKSALLHKVSKEKSKMILEILNVPLENNFSRREELDLVANKNIESHVKRYKWFISRNGADVEYTIEQAKEKLNGIDKKKFIEDYRKNITEIIDTIILAKKILGKKLKRENMRRLICYHLVGETCWRESSMAQSCLGLRRLLEMCF